MTPNNFLSTELFRFSFAVPDSPHEYIHIAAKGWISSMKYLEEHVRANPDVFPPWERWINSDGQVPENLAVRRIYSPCREGFLYLETGNTLAS